MPPPRLFPPPRPSLTARPVWLQGYVIKVRLPCLPPSQPLLSPCWPPHLLSLSARAQRRLLDPALMARARDDMAEHFEEVLADEGWEEWQGFRSHMPVDDKPWLVDMLPANPSVAGIVEQLLGKGSVAPIGDKIRGVNCNLPIGHGAPAPDGPD
eukprot:COSAG04_NODE_6136_length_1402_cov_1.183423_1_plen_153_part_10